MGVCQHFWEDMDLLPRLMTKSLFGNVTRNLRVLMMIRQTLCHSSNNKTLSIGRDHADFIFGLANVEMVTNAITFTRMEKREDQPRSNALIKAIEIRLGTMQEGM
jgi:hypothetical protein